jgi:hypothetical protein
VFVLLCALPLVAAPARGQGREAVVIGSVRDSAGLPVADAEVKVLGSALRARTDERGDYRLVALLPGRATITARRLGFLAASRAVRLMEGDNHLADLVLRVAPQVLDELSTVSAREVSESRLAGFNARRLQHVGHFVTRERIERANSETLVDVLREIPGLRIGSQGTTGRLVRIRSSTCPPLVFMDGFPATAGEFDLDMIDLATVEGIEVYSGLGSLPPEFSGPRDLDRCGVIAIWSRPAGHRRRSSTAPDAPPAGRIRG